MILSLSLSLSLPPSLSLSLSLSLSDVSHSLWTFITLDEDESYIITVVHSGLGTMFNLSLINNFTVQWQLGLMLELPSKAEVSTTSPLWRLCSSKFVAANNVASVVSLICLTAELIFTQQVCGECGKMHFVCTYSKDRVCLLWLNWFGYVTSEPLQHSVCVCVCVCVCGVCVCVCALV